MMRQSIKIFLVGVIFATALAIFSVISITENLHNQKIIATNIPISKELPNFQHIIKLYLPQKNKFQAGFLAKTKLNYINSNQNENIDIPLAYPPASKKNIAYIYLPNLLPGSYNLLTPNEKITFTIKNFSNISNVVDPTPETCLTKDIGTLPTCLSDYFNPKIQDLKSALTALDQLKILSLKNTNIRNVCHTVAHDIGERTILVNRGNPSFIPGYAFCDSGFYHGLFEGNAIYISTPELSKNIANLCIEYSYLYSTGGCSHSLGHIAYWRTGNYSNALKLCALVEKSKFNEVAPASECVGGATMTYLFDLQAQVNSNNISSDYAAEIKNLQSDPFSLCINKDKNISAGCLSHIWLYYVNFNKSIDKSVLEQCNNPSFTDLESHECWYGFGQSLGNGLRNTIENLYPSCYIASRASGELGCFDGLMNFFLNSTLHPHFESKICSKINSLVPLKEKTYFCQADLKHEESINQNGLSSSSTN